MRVQGVRGQLVLAIAFGTVAFLVPVSGAAHALLANTDGGWEYWLGICCRFLLAAPTAMILFANSQAGLDLYQAIQPIVRCMVLVLASFFLLDRLLL